MSTLPETVIETISYLELTVKDMENSEFSENAENRIAYNEGFEVLLEKLSLKGISFETSIVINNFRQAIFKFKGIEYLADKYFIQPLKG